MEKTVRRFSLFISLLIHAVVLAIPISFTVKKQFNEVEVFILDERPMPLLPKKEVVNKPKKTELPKSKELPEEKLPPKIVEEKLPQAKVEAKREEKVVLEQKTIEPTERVEKEEGKVSVKAPPTVFGNPSVSSFEKVALSVVPTGGEKGEKKRIEEFEFGSNYGPRFLHREMPVYPLIARRLGKEGVVKLRLTIDERGRLLEVEVLEGAGYGFTESALEAVKKSTFIPAYKEGKPIMCKALLTIRFTLRRGE
ncbi:MAG: TonB family protein [Caldimicrobium sp.]